LEIYYPNRLFVLIKALKQSSFPVKLEKFGGQYGCGKKEKNQQSSEGAKEEIKKNAGSKKENC
jgi:hypothetical protein